MYKVIATNRGESAEEVVKWYNQRGECSENWIKELKIGFGMERMPCGKFGANAVFFRISVLAYIVRLGANQDTYPVRTFSELGRMVLEEGYRPKAVEPCTVRRPVRALVRKAVQGMNNFYWF